MGEARAHLCQEAAGVVVASLPAVVEEVEVRDLLGEAEVVGAPKRGCLAAERRDQAVEAEVGATELQIRVQEAVTPVDLGWGSWWALPESQQQQRHWGW